MEDPTAVYESSPDSSGEGGGCSGLLGFLFSLVWLFFTLMYFLTEPGVIPMEKLEFTWRFFAGPVNFFL